MSTEKKYKNVAKFPVEALEVSLQVDKSALGDKNLAAFISKKKRPGKLIHSSKGGKTYKKQ